VPATAARRTLSARTAAALALVLLAAGCSGSPAPEEDPSAASSPAAEASDAGGASDGGGKTAAAVPQESYEVTPAPEGFTPQEPCSGEGAYFTEVGGDATPDLPERAGESLTVSLEGIEGDRALLVATVGDSPAREIEAITLGETVTVDMWTLSVTSVCADTQQVEFDLID
jgi:hypothetical protein